MAKSMRTAFVRVHLVNDTKDGDVKYTIEQLADMFRSIADTYLGCEYAYILHDKDVDPDGKNKAPHVHCLFRFKSPVSFDSIKKKIPYGSIENARSVNAAIQYLAHKNNPEKTQYSFSDIHGNIKEAELEKLFTEVKTENSKKVDPDLAFIIENIMNGNIREYNKFEHIDNYKLVKYNRQINIAFKLRSENIMQDGNRNIRVQFIEGPGGSGKTALAKDIARGVGDGSYCVSGSQNDSIENYKGQNTLILDDLRDDAFEWADLLKILDNNTGTPIRSRYFNKIFLGSLIIITTNKPLTHWYEYIREDKATLRRRISAYYKVTREELKIYVPDPNNNYELAYKLTVPNPNTEKIKLEQAVRDADLEKTLTILSGMSSTVADAINVYKRSLTGEDHEAFRKRVAQEHWEQLRVVEMTPDFQRQYDEFLRRKEENK